MYSAPSEGQRLETGENQGSYPALLYNIYMYCRVPRYRGRPIVPLQKRLRGVIEREVENPI